MVRRRLLVSRWTPETVPLEVELGDMLISEVKEIPFQVLKRHERTILL